MRDDERARLVCLTMTDSFEPDAKQQYAELPLDSDLPGTCAARTGELAVLPNREAGRPSRRCRVAVTRRASSVGRSSGSTSPSSPDDAPTATDGFGDPEIATAEWVDWLNDRRPFEDCDDRTPVEAEHAHYRHAW